MALASAATHRRPAPMRCQSTRCPKVGEDPHWKPGVDLFADFGLKLAVVPHWTTTAAREFGHQPLFPWGLARFEPLLAMLPKHGGVLGVDEQTGRVWPWIGRLAPPTRPGQRDGAGPGAAQVFGRGASSL